MKKLIAFILIIFLCCNITYASDTIKFYAGMQTGFTAEEEDAPEYVTFVTNEEVKINDEITIPAGALISAKVYQFQKERRWHKSGFFICSLTEFSVPDGEVTDVSNKEIYFIVRKYEALNKKEAGILSTEIILTQAASIVGSCFIVFAPVDIAYFFTKGAIIRKKHPNWFKSGVMEAYDNSIFWFWLKGKPIELSEGDNVKLKSVSEKRANKINTKISKKKEKKFAKKQRKEMKKEAKQAKRAMKKRKKEANNI